MDLDLDKTPFYGWVLFQSFTFEYCWIKDRLLKNIIKDREKLLYFMGFF